MADFEQALLARLVADSGVAALAGSRLYWGIIPQGKARPYVRLQVISDPRPQHLKGYFGARQTRVRADCMADKYGDARALAAAVIAALAEPATQDGVHFGRTKAEGPRTDGEDTDSGFVHRASVDLLAEHKLA